MKNINSVIIAIASTGFLSLLSFSATASTSIPVTLEEKIQEAIKQQVATEEKKYNQIVSLAGIRQDELTTKKNEVIDTYNKWSDLKYAVVSHYPTTEDYKAIEIAAKAYSQAYKAYINLQKSILSQNGIPLDKVATRIIAME
jgi:hypothetical protein